MREQDGSSVGRVYLRVKPLQLRFVERILFVTRVQPYDLPVAVAQVEVACLLSQGWQDVVEVPIAAAVVVVVTRQGEIAAGVF